MYTTDGFWFGFNAVFGVIFAILLILLGYGIGRVFFEGLLIVLKGLWAILVKTAIFLDEGLLISWMKLFFAENPEAMTKIKELQQ